MGFDARINYYQEEKTIATEPEFFNSETKEVVKALRKEIKAQKLNVDDLKKRVERDGIIL